MATQNSPFEEVLSMMTLLSQVAGITSFPNSDLGMQFSLISSTYRGIILSVLIPKFRFGNAIFIDKFNLSRYYSFQIRI